MKYKVGTSPNLPLSNDRIFEVNNSICTLFLSIAFGGYYVVAMLPLRASEDRKQP
jgi:hypothetical protein